MDSVESLVTKIIIDNVNPTTTLQGLYDFLQLKTLTVKGFDSLSLGVDKHGNSCGIAFLEVPCTMKTRIIKMNGRELDGRQLKISLQKKSDRRNKFKKWTVDYSSPGFFQSLSRNKSQMGNQINLIRKDRGPILIDMGAELTHRKFKTDIDPVITKAVYEGVECMVIPGKSLAQTEEAKKLCNLYPKCLKFTAGIAPLTASKGENLKPESLSALKKMAVHPNCVGIGLTGLDFRYDTESRSKQIDAFEAQIKVAQNLGKPLFVVERNAHVTLWKILQKYKTDLPKCVIFCFTGTVAEAKKYIKMGCYIALSGFVAENKYSLTKNVMEALQKRVIPPERILLASDSPYKQRHEDHNLRPTVSDAASKKVSAGSRNCPCSLFTVLELVANELKMDENELADTIHRSTQSFWGKPEKKQPHCRNGTTTFRSGRKILIFVIVAAVFALFSVFFEYSRKNDHLLMGLH